MKAPSFLIAAATTALLSPASASTVSWNGNTSGNWSEATNWISAAAYPNSSGTNEVTVDFRGNGTGANTIELDVDVTIAGLTMRPTASRSYNLKSDTGKKITLQNSTDIADFDFTSGGGVARVVAVNMTLDVAQVNLVGRLATFSGNLTATEGRSVTFNVNANQSSPAATDIFILSGSNHLGTDGVITLAGPSALELQNVNASGGANTVIKFNSTTTNTTLNLNTSGAMADYKSAVEVADNVTGKIYLKQNGAATGTNRSVLGALTVGKNSTLLLTGFTSGYLSTSGTVHIQEGGTLVARPDRSNSASSLAFSLQDGAVLAGEGTVGTTAFGSGVNKAIILESGALLAPGDPTESGSTGILSIGDTGDYSATQLTLNSGARVRFDLNGLIAGEGHDQIHVAGSSTFTITGAEVEFNLLSTSYTSSDEVILVKFDSTAIRVGQFSGLTNGSVVSLGGGSSATLYYDGGDGNDIVLRQFVVVPEPQTLVFFGIGIAALAGSLRRRAGKRA